MGLLVIALLPDAAEIVNGIQFARQNNIALSIEVRPNPHVVECGMWNVECGLCGV